MTIQELIDKKEKELEKIVFCKCGKLKEHYYADLCYCKVYKEEEDEEHENDDFLATTEDLAVWEFIQQLKQ